jgi:hypothetical protein
MGEAEQIVCGERGLELGRAAGGGGQYVAEIGERGIGDQPSGAARFTSESSLRPAGSASPAPRVSP